MTDVACLIIVGADKGGVGKTTVARALLDFLERRGIPVRAFDGQNPNGDLVRFAASAEIVDLRRLEDQVRIFDAVGEKPTLLDLPAGMLSPTLHALDDAKLLDDVRRGVLRLILLHVLGPSMSSISEVASLAKQIGAARHFLVKNFINETRFFEWDRSSAQDYWRSMAASTISVPMLPELAAEVMQKRGGSFSAFVNDVSESRVLRGRVETWLEQTEAEFARVRLHDLLASGAAPAPAAT